MNPERVVAHQAPDLQARLIRRWPLTYTRTADNLDDHPAHARAGSGLCWFDNRLAVIQDDANFIALVDPARGTVEAVPLPAGMDQRRLFDKARGNKRYKLDLESCVGLQDPHGDMLISFGSGSTPLRETVAWLNASGARLLPAHAFYAALRNCPQFSGSELNIEGAVLLPGGWLRLFQRGNGAPRGDQKPVNATCDIEWEALWKHLASPADEPVPPLQRVTQYDLGSIEGVPLTFTDATRVADNAIFYLASAEDSPDAVQDGEVRGTAIGVLSDSARWTFLEDERGDPLLAKAEGIVMHPNDPGRGYVCLDPDDPDRPTELCEIELSGNWPG